MLSPTLPHVRGPVATRHLLNAFVVASLPAMIIGVWNVGYQTLLIARDRRIDLSLDSGGSLMGTMGMGTSPDDVVACFVFGALRVLPLFAAVFAVAYGWERVFAHVRQRAVDPAWFMTAWLLVLLLPPATPILLAVVAISFAAIIGTHIFGGTGRYLVSPALLGVLFLNFSYPGFVTAVLPLADVELVTSWVQLVRDGPGSLSFAAAFAGAELGGIGTVSAAACLIGAAYLVRAGAASARTLLGAIFGLLGATFLANWAGEGADAWVLPWYWHLALGNFAFAVAFLATDPTATPLTRPGRWVHGVLIGCLVVTLRVVDPAHPEGTLFAVLLAGLAVPLIDHLALRWIMRRAQHRLGVP